MKINYQKSLYYNFRHYLITYFRYHFRLDSDGRAEHKRDRKGLSASDIGTENAIKKGTSWIYRAQESSTSRDGGVGKYYSHLSGWSASYPETTGYIVPTLLRIYRNKRDQKARDRARKMLDWLVSIQYPDGSFQGDSVDSKDTVKVAFNTGQILLGLAAGVREFGEDYREPMRKAADWLVKTQDSDGCWRAYPSPFCIPGEKTYDTHVAWSLLEAHSIESKKDYAEAALSNVCWALSLQKENGWFDKCCVSHPSMPLTHTLGYVFRGILEAYKFSQKRFLLNACKSMADGLLSATREDGFIPGRLLSNWESTDNWSCLTGSVQIAYCWLRMYQYTDYERYRDAAYAVNKFVRRTMHDNGPIETKGAVKGSFPIYGGYCQYAYPNWACKFFIDSNMLEMDIRAN